MAQLKARLSNNSTSLEARPGGGGPDPGVPVAKIVPLATLQEHDESRRERLVKAGLCGPGRAGPAHALRVPRGPREGYGVLRALLDERDEGR